MSAEEAENRLASLALSEEDGAAAVDGKSLNSTSLASKFLGRSCGHEFAPCP